MNISFKDGPIIVEMSVRLSAVIKLRMTNLWHGRLKWHAKLICSAPKRIWSSMRRRIFIWKESNHNSRTHPSPMSMGLTDQTPFVVIFMILDVFVIVTN